MRKVIAVSFGDYVLSIVNDINTQVNAATTYSGAIEPTHPNIATIYSSLLTLRAHNGHYLKALHELPCSDKEAFRVSLLRFFGYQHDRDQLSLAVSKYTQADRDGLYEVGPISLLPLYNALYQSSDTPQIAIFDFVASFCATPGCAPSLELPMPELLQADNANLSTLTSCVTCRSDSAQLRTHFPLELLWLGLPKDPSTDRPMEGVLEPLDTSSDMSHL